MKEKNLVTSFSALSKSNQALLQAQNMQVVPKEPRRLYSNIGTSFDKSLNKCSKPSK